MAERRYPGGLMDASLLNVRKQKQLEHDLIELERNWYVKLKEITRQRLELMRDLLDFEHQKRANKHLSIDLKGRSLQSYRERHWNNVQNVKHMRKNKHNFQLDPIEKVPLHLSMPKPGDDFTQNGTEFLNATLRGNNLGLPRYPSLSNLKASFKERTTTTLSNIPEDTPKYSKPTQPFVSNLKHLKQEKHSNRTSFKKPRLYWSLPNLSQIAQTSTPQVIDSGRVSNNSLVTHTD